MFWVDLAIAEERCEPITARDIVSIPAPAVIVLGERRGTQPDLFRATHVAKKLNEAAKVTVALEAVPQRLQPVLDGYARQQVPAADLEARLEWASASGYPFGPYRPLVQGADLDMDVLAVGPDPGAVSGEKLPVPSGYLHILHDGMSGSDVPAAMVQRFLQSVVRADASVARSAVRSWDGTGYLVIVTDRARVEGGKGVPFQVAQLTDKPVHAFVLSWGGTPPCYPGDRVWAKGILG
jgi:hypothetical protein